MKRNFTNLFLVAAFALGFASNGYAQCDPPVPTPEGALFSWQFDGGLGDWTATNLDGEAVDHASTTPGAGDGTVFGWVWEPDGKVAGGAYNTEDGANDFIVSSSVCNGSMVFNADFYDNEGVAGNFGAGVCPNTAPVFCDGLLNSPVVDLSGFDGEVNLEFEQGVRQFTSEFYVLLSNDGGMTYFDTLTVNGDLPVNSAHILDQTVTVPLCGAKGATEFQFSIWYRASYYYWAIDDVRLMPSNSTDVRVNRNFAAVSPTYGVPSNMTFDVPFLADIENVSALEAIAPNLNVTVSDGVGSALHTQDRTYDNVSGCRTDENKPFPDLYTLPSDEGEYTVTYTIDESTDENFANDTVSGNFLITENRFMKAKTEEEAGAEYLDGWRPGGDANFKSWGSYYYMPNNDLGQGIVNVETGIVFGANEVPNAGELVMSVYQWVDANNDGIVNSGDFEEKTKLGEATQIVLPGTPVGDYRSLVFEPRDEEDEMIIPQVDPNNPEAGIQLLVMLHTNPFSTDINYFGLGFQDGDRVTTSTRASTLAYTELGLQDVRYGSFQANGVSADDADEGRDFNESGVNFFVNLNLTPPNNTEEINENLNVNVFPSPASTEINVELNLEELSEAVTIDLVNMAGSTVGSFSFRNVKEERLNVDVSRFPGGMYLMNIRTNSGMISKKVSIVH